MSERIDAMKQFIEQYPEDHAAQILSSLVLALETEHPFEVTNIYQLDIDHFELAIEILKEWRLDRYYAGKAKLFDLSMQAAELAG